MKIQNICTFKTATLTKISAFAFILLLAMTLMMAFAQPSLAQIGVPQPEVTTGFISVAPTVIGVGQTATVNLWVFPLPTTYLYTPYFGGFNGITVTFIKPDGTEDTYMPVDGTGQFDPGQTEATGSLYSFYTPDMAGDWSVTMSMPAQDITDSTGTVQYLGCTSEPFYFTVTEEEQLAGLLNGYPWAELPDENTYWSYPINTNNREWSAISGDWLVRMNDATVYGPTFRHWQPYGSAPSTGHILWYQRYNKGGIIGGVYGSLSDMTSTSTDKGALIMNGKVFYNIYGANQFQCVDIATGEILYTQDGFVHCAIHLPGNPFAQSMLDPSVVLQGSFGSNVASYVVSTMGGTWNYYDTLSGTLSRTLSDARSARMIDGTNLAYGASGGTFYAWDLSKVVGNNWTTGIIWEQPKPEANAIARGVNLFGISADLSTVVISSYNQYWGYSAQDGTPLWNLTLDYPVATNEEFDLWGVNKFIVFEPTYSRFRCYSMLTGAELWISDTVVADASWASAPWASTWTVYNSETNDYENLYLALPDGTVIALNLETGNTVWRSEPIPSTEYTYNAKPFVYGCKLVGGKIFAFGGYSMGYGINPIPRFAELVCIDATTGDIDYTLNGGVYPSAAANGYIIGAGYYDGNMYCIGKGPTKTTVSAPQTAVPKGTAMVITGSVLDMSPASQEYDSKVLFPNGVPAVADEDVNEFMDYLYMQNSTLLNNPPTPDGVPVNLYVVKPDGTEEWVATVTSDSDGTYAYEYVPTSEGIYKVIANFEGTGSYWPSSSQTYITATPAAATGGPIETEEPTTPPPTEEPTTSPPTEEPTTEVPTTEEPTTTPPTEEPSAEALVFPTTEVVVVAAVAVAAVIGIGAYWALRRR